MRYSLLLGALAAAAVAPTVTTGTPTRITETSARLNGTVNPKGQDTSYSFDYGTGTNYGANTGPVAAGNGTKSVHAQADVSGLAPATTYHFRIVATNASGTTVGADRSFTTHGGSLQYGVRASATSLVYGAPLTINGTLKGTNAAGRQLVLQGRGAPYTGTWATVGGPVTTSGTGAYSFRVNAMRANMQLRVAPSDGLANPSRELTVTVAPRISTRLSTAHPRRGGIVRFSGTIRPARDGAQFGIQRRAGSKWVTVAGGVARHASGGVSTWVKRVRIRSSGDYRVFVRITGGTLASGAGRVKHVRVR